MPDNPIASLYPQAPNIAGGNALSGDPTRVIGMMNALNQNALFQKEFAAKNAQANALQGAIGTDGSFDPSAYGNTIKNDPNAAFGLDPASLMQQQILQRETAMKGLALGASQNDQIRQLVAGTRSKDDLLNLAPTLTRIGVPADMVANAVAGAPSNPKDYNSWKGMFGNIAMGPAAAATRVAGPVNAQGQQTQVPLGAANAVGGYATANAPGSEQSAQEMQSDLAREGNYAQDIFPWQKSLELIQKLGPGGTGPGTQGRQQVESFVNALSPTVARWAGVDPNKIQNYDELTKYLTQATQARAAGFGAHTDSQLATTISGSPNTHISDLANTDVIKAAIALKRMEHAQVMYASGAGAPNYTSAKSASAPKFDPRAFALPDMSQDQVDQLKSSLTGDERKRFNRSLQIGVATGALTPPGQ